MLKNVMGAAIAIKAPMIILIAVVVIAVIVVAIVLVRKGGSSTDKTTGNGGISKAYAKAMADIEKGKFEEAIKTLCEIASEESTETEDKEVIYDSRRFLGDLYYKGNVNGLHKTVDLEKAIDYYAKCEKIKGDNEIELYLGRMYQDKQEYTKAVEMYEKSASANNNSACLKLGNIYEEGIHKVDAYGNKGEYIIEIDLEKARQWYEISSKMDDPQGRAAFERVDYLLNHEDSVEFEQKEKLYSKIAERRKANNVQLKCKSIEAAKLQYQYTYIHNETEGYIHKLPKDWVKCVNDETEEEYYAPSENYKDFAIYVSYDSVPKESERPLEVYLRYENDAMEDELTIKDYVSEYSDGICTTFFHKGIEKGIVSFAFAQQNRIACLRFVCASMEIIEQYDEIIFEVANSFAFVDPTIASDDSANRKEVQYYNQAVFHYTLEEYQEAMEFAKKALKAGSKKASYLLLEMYYDSESPYSNYEKAVKAAEELFEYNNDPDLAFMIGSIYDQQFSEFNTALEWYEKADELGHNRVPFYLGRLYYYGVISTKRDGKKALTYFRKALNNGIAESEAYIKDIEALGNLDLQASIERLEKAIENGDSDKAIDVAIKKKEQVFYLAKPDEIEQAFLKACELGNARAPYELGLIYREKEKAAGYTGSINSIIYFEKAFDKGYDEFDKESLYAVVNKKVEEGLSNEQQVKLYISVASKGYIPAVDKLINLVSTLTFEISKLYKELRVMASKGDVSALKSMSKLEKAYPGLLKQEIDLDKYKVVTNKFFNIAVPKECNAVINDEGGKIKIADSVIDFAVAEMPVQANSEDDYLKVYNLIVGEYLEDENAEILVLNSKIVGSAMVSAGTKKNSISILLISAKNQYLFKLSASNRIELMNFRDRVMAIACSLSESGETYIATGDKANKRVGISLLLEGESTRSGFYAIGMDDSDSDGFEIFE